MTFPTEIDRKHFISFPRGSSASEQHGLPLLWRPSWTSLSPSHSLPHLPLPPPTPHFLIFPLPPSPQSPPPIPLYPTPHFARPPNPHPLIAYLPPHSLRPHPTAQDQHSLPPRGLAAGRSPYPLPLQHGHSVNLTGSGLGCLPRPDLAGFHAELQLWSTTRTRPSNVLSVL